MSHHPNLEETEELLKSSLTRSSKRDRELFDAMVTLLEKNMNRVRNLIDTLIPNNFDSEDQRSAISKIEIGISDLKRMHKNLLELNRSEPILENRERIDISKLAEDKKERHSREEQMKMLEKDIEVEENRFLEKVPPEKRSDRLRYNRRMKEADRKSVPGNSPYTKCDSPRKVRVSKSHPESLLTSDRDENHKDFTVGIPLVTKDPGEGRRAPKFPATKQRIFRISKSANSSRDHLDNAMLPEVHVTSQCSGQREDALTPQNQLGNFLQKNKIWIAFILVILAVLAFILAILYFAVTLIRSLSTTASGTATLGAGNDSLMIL